MEPKHISRNGLDMMGSVVALTVMLVYAFTVIAPYFFQASGDTATMEIIKANKNTVDLITTAVVMFFFGASVGRQRDAENLNIVAKTNAAQTAALAPVVGAVAGTDVLQIEPGEEKRVVGVDSPQS
jgi:hypothetical protein